MDPIVNPYAPGAGSPPPELAGREELRESVRVALARVQQGRAAKSMLLTGLRGVGKTVLLGRMMDDAEGSGLHTLWTEAPEDRSLPAVLTPQLRKALIRLSQRERSREAAQKALRGLAGFVCALRVQYQDISVGLDFEPEQGLADSGDLEYDLQNLLEVCGEAAREGGTSLVMFIDELQYVEKSELAALIVALHYTARRGLPVTLVGAGLPQLPGRMGKAKSYAERLFEFPIVDALPEQAARLAIERPAHQSNVWYDEDALKAIIQQTHRYPYFLQEWGKHVWDAADQSPITLKDVNVASRTAIAALDESFFKVRFDRLTSKERQYLQAMAELGPGPHRSGDIAEALDRAVESVAPLRNGLISKGMVSSPSHGDTAFTVPLFDEFMRRTMPGSDSIPDTNTTLWAGIPTNRPTG